MIKTLCFRTAMFDVSKERESPINPMLGISLLTG